MKARLPAIALGLIVAGGLLLRLAGFDHDLSAGWNYHPDAAKQLRATQMFLQGIYYINLGIPDWDGYPLLNSHLLELTLRAYRAVVQGAATLLGIPVVVDYPAYEANWFFWIGRAMNTLIGTVAIVVAHRMGKRCFGALAGLLAALFLAGSPIDVVACHYEGGDTTAALLAGVAVIFALRVLESGRIIDYVAAAFFVTCGFAAKYHAGMAVAPLAVAHVLHWRRREHGVLGPAAVGRVVITAVAAADSLFLAIPSLWSNLTAQVTDIVAYMRFLWTSTASRIPELANAGFGARMTYALEHQAPVLLRLFGPWIGATLLFAAVRLRDKAEAVAVLVSLPLVYLIFGISFRPVVQPVYHTLMTLPVLVLCAGVLAASVPAPSSRSTWLGLRAVLAVLCVTSLFRATLREDFFFLHMDSQRIGLEWAQENVPMPFARVIADYTIPDDPSWRHVAAAPFPGTLLTTGVIRPLPVPSEAMLLQRLDLESGPSLPVYRNPNAELYALSPSLRRENFRIPPVPRRPPTSPSDYVFVGGRDFYHSPAILAVEPGRAAQRIFVSPVPLGDALLLVRNGGRATTLAVSFGGIDRTILLAPNESLALSVPSPRDSFPSEAGRHFYPLDAASDDGPVWVTAALDPFDKGWGLFQQARYSGAHRWLVEAARDRDPMVAGLAVISGVVSGVRAPTDDDWLSQMAAPLRSRADERELDERYGGAVGYLSGLQYAAGEAERADRRGLMIVTDAAASEGLAVHSAATVPRSDAEMDFAVPMLAPGRYRVELRFRREGPGSPTDWVELQLLSTSLADEAKRILVPLSSWDGSYVERSVALAVDRFEPHQTLRITVPPGSRLLIDRVHLAPDLSEQWNDLGLLLKMVAGELAVPPPLLGAVAREPLAALAERRLAQGEVEGAIQLYERLTPAPPQERPGDVRAARAFHSLTAEFDGGLRLLGYRLRERSAKPGEAIHLSLYWDAQNVRGRFENPYVWIHFLDARGNLLFAPDQPLGNMLGMRIDSHELLPEAVSLELPVNTPPGPYRIEIGVSSRGRKLGIGSAERAVKHGGVTLPQAVTVERG